LKWLVLKLDLLALMRELATLEIYLECPKSDSSSLIATVEGFHGKL
jgi:hypothetical protein